MGTHEASDPVLLAFSHVKTFVKYHAVAFLINDEGGSAPPIHLSVCLFTYIHTYIHDDDPITYLTQVSICKQELNRPGEGTPLTHSAEYIFRLL